MSYDFPPGFGHVYPLDPEPPQHRQKAGPKAKPKKPRGPWAAKPGHRVIANGIEYLSISAAARACGITTQGLRYHLRKGHLDYSYADAL
jgi:hypothetical protein